MSLEQTASRGGLDSPVNTSLLATCDLSLHENEDDLHLAARVGQALLVKNEGLEERVQQLQALLDETTAKNRMLHSQVERLHASCRHLEDDREQLESSLRLYKEEVEVLRHKNSLAGQQVGKLEATIDQLHEQCRQGDDKIAELHMENDKLVSQSQGSSKDGDISDTQPSPREESSVVCSHAHLSEEVSQLRQQLQDLSAQRLADQNDHAEEITRLVGEREQLERRLKLAQGLADDLQQQNCSTPKRLHTPTSTMMSPALSPVPREQDPLSGMLLPVGKQTHGSLWNEMGSHYELLQKNFDQLKQHCCCGAASATSSSGVAVLPNSSTMPALSLSSTSDHQRLFNELFDMLHRFKMELHS